MKNRYWLFRRHGVFYLQDAHTRQRESLKTSNRREAARIRDARNQAAERPGLGIAMAKAYLTAHDPQITAIQIDQGIIRTATNRGLRPTAIPDITARARTVFRLVDEVV